MKGPIVTRNPPDGRYGLLLQPVRFILRKLYEKAIAYSRVFPVYRGASMERHEGQKRILAHTLADL